AMSSTCRSTTTTRSESKRRRMLRFESLMPRYWVVGVERRYVALVQATVFSQAGVAPHLADPEAPAPRHPAPSRPQLAPAHAPRVGRRSDPRPERCCLIWNC